MQSEGLSTAIPFYELAMNAAETPRRARRYFGVKVLLVDDDAADPSLILSVLNRHPTVATTSATDSPSFALRELAMGHLKPDLILLDIQMPRMDGFEFLEELREIPPMARAPVVFLTTSRRRVDIANARRSSASLYLVKPDTYAELTAHLNGVIRRAATGEWGGAAQRS